ncbi:MAG: ATPase [Candidatus Muiribacterium halophilum]|uniref:ATPase n=1 Tax=Muiribacterium halophilum TaxID=2053465 RepID=A0A2N5ZBA0_MUIH1|nr:MAG: ATPase [Candidatus Muirbacterium halophilum]
MIKRKITDYILNSMEIFPVVSILGSRQVGKTTLAKDIKKILENKNKDTIYLDLELPSDLNIINNAELFFENNKEKTIIIDEIQVKPELYPIIRAHIDKKRRNGAFILLGSSSSTLKKNTSESLAGRIIQHILNPFDFLETGDDKEKINRLWLRGGYPESFLAKNDSNSFLWRSAFLKTFFERDIPQFGINIPSQKLKQFWQMISHYHGQVWNASQIARSLGLSAPTIRNYMEIFEETFLVRRLSPYYVNLKKRITKSPKFFIIDSGMFHLTHNIEDLNSLLGFPMAGASWEGFVIEQIIRNLDNKTEYYYYRTQTGNEVDLVLKENDSITAIEVKLSMTPKLSKGLKISMDDLNAEKGFIIYPGEKRYSLSDKVEAISLKEFIDL